MDEINCELRIQSETSARYMDSYLGDLKIDGKIENNQFVHRTVELYRQWIRNPEQCRRKDLETLGWHLYNIIFRTGTVVDSYEGKTIDEGKIRDAFEKTYKRFQENKKSNPDLHLRLKLTFESSAERLAQYPWEFLYMPWGDTGFFLAGQKTDLILTRFVPEAGKVDTLATEEDVLRILVVVSQPTGQAWELVSDDVYVRIKELESNKQVRVDKLEERASYSELRRKINEFRPHIVHLICHGINGKLVLLKDIETLRQGEAENEKRRANNEPLLEISDAYPVDGVTLRDLLIPDLPDPPRLVFLHACKGAVDDSIASLRSVARELIAAKIPCVVAMQYKISNDDASLFATTFYDQIGRGRAIDEAVTAARNALGTAPRFPLGSWDNPSFGTPVLYLQSDKATLLPQRGKVDGKHVAAGDAGIETDPEPPRKVNCPYPDCNGLVKPEANFCLKCKRKLMKCPNPKCATLMPGQSPDMMCDNCGWTAETEAGPKAAKMAPAKKGPEEWA